MRSTPAAAVAVSIPSGSAMPASADSDAAASSGSSPPRKKSGLIPPRATCASVTDGVVPPRP